MPIELIVFLEHPDGWKTLHIVFINICIQVNTDCGYVAAIQNFHIYTVLCPILSIGVLKNIVSTTVWSPVPSL